MMSPSTLIAPGVAWCTHSQKKQDLGGLGTHGTGSTDGRIDGRQLESPPALSIAVEADVEPTGGG